VTEGRRREFSGFRAFEHPELRETIPDPQAAETFFRSKLDLREREANAGLYRLYRDLLQRRRADPVLRVQDRARTRVGVVGAQTLVLDRWDEKERRLLVVNFGPSLAIRVDDPALGGLRPEAMGLLLSTDDPAYGGGGRFAGLHEVDGEERLEMPARTAALFGVG
jgi:hypothetical protein